jgi:hypothetical protein
MTLPEETIRLGISGYFGLGIDEIPEPTPDTGPVESLVREFGQLVAIVSCITPAYDDYDVMDADTSVWQLSPIRAILSSPSERESRDLAGRGLDVSRRATLGTAIRVRPWRDGQGDLLLEIPDADIISVAGSGSTWSITVAYTGEPSGELGVEILPPPPVEVVYEVEFGAHEVRIVGLDLDQYRVYRIVEARNDRHPFLGVTKHSLYLQEVQGR